MRHTRVLPPQLVEVVAGGAAAVGRGGEQGDGSGQLLEGGGGRPSGRVLRERGTNAAKVQALDEARLGQLQTCIVGFKLSNTHTEHSSHSITHLRPI